MEVRKMPRRLALAAALITTGAAALAAVPAASAHAIPLRVGPADITHIGMPGIGASGLTGGTVAYSTNWSGYAVTGSTYNTVTATWTQPAVTCSQSSTYAAFWAGLDGYSSSTVEQDGTLAECVSTSRHSRTLTPEYLAWYEAYPAPMYQFGGAVVPGDTLNSTVSWSSSTSFTLLLTDTAAGSTTPKWSAVKTVSVRNAARSSAEVIAEAPSSGSVLPLANFGTMNFTGSSVNGLPLTAATQIDMITNRRAAEATPGSLGSNGAFSVTWIS